MRYIYYFLSVFVLFFFPACSFAQGYELNHLPFNMQAVLLVFSVLAITLFSYEWYSQIKKIKKYKEELDIKDVLISASIGGYYLWREKTQQEEVSEGLLNLLNISSYDNSFKDIAKKFEDSKEIEGYFEALKVGSLHNFSENFKFNIGKDSKNFLFKGYRVENSVGQLKGIIIWVYDISDYITKCQSIEVDNKKLIEDISKLEEVLDTIPIPVWKRDKTLNIVYCNKSYYSYLNEGEFDTFSIKDLCEKSKDIARKAFNKNEIEHFKAHLVKDGKREKFDLVEVPNKKTGSLVGYAYSVNEEEKVSKDLARHIKAHDNLLESSSSAMAIYGVDKKLEFYNNAFMKLWGLEEKWLDSKPSYGEILEELRKKRVLPEQANFTEFRKKQMQMFTDLIKPHNEFYYLADGRALRVIVIPHALGGLLFAYEDMSDRLAIERSLNTLAAVQKTTLDNLNEGIAVFGQDGRMKLYNEKYKNIWDEEVSLLKSNPHISELVEASKENFIYSGSWDNFKSKIISDTAERKSVIRRCKLKNGRYIDRISTPLPDGATLVSYVDITDSIMVEQSLRERNEALEEADRLKTEFLANVSYELRTPLTSILGFSEALLNHYYGNLNERQDDYVRGIYHSSSDLMNIINNILDLASIEAGYMSIDISTVNVKDHVKQAIRHIEDSDDISDIDIVINSKIDNPEIDFDIGRLDQVLFNVIENAVKFSRVNSAEKIEIKISDTKKTIKVEVIDNGIGIPKDEVKKICERFYKAKNAIKNGIGGTGLGLAVVKNIMEMHGGKVKIESEEDKGCKVVLVFEKVIELDNNEVRKQIAVT